MRISHWIITVTMAAGFSGAAFAENISKEAYNTAKSQAEMEFRTAKQKCDSFAGNAKDICLVEAKGALSVAKADAEANYKGTEPARLKAAKAKVEVKYQVAKERCDDLSDNKKDVCRQEAKTVKVKGDEAAQLASKNRRGVAMKGFVQDIEGLATKNDKFRQVLYTAKNCQLVVMALKPKEELGAEVHKLDQFFRVEEGSGEAVLDGVHTAIKAGFAVLVPAGTNHNIINTGKTLYDLCAPKSSGWCCPPYPTRCGSR